MNDAAPKHDPTIVIGHVARCGYCKVISRTVSAASGSVYIPPEPGEPVLPPTTARCGKCGKHDKLTRPVMRN